MPQFYDLVGYVDFGYRKPYFVEPVFSKNSDKEYLVQDLDAKGVVREFKALPEDEEYPIFESDDIRKLGHSTYVGDRHTTLISLDKSHFFCGNSIIEVARKVLYNETVSKFHPNPIFLLYLAAIIEDRNLEVQYAKLSYQAISKFNPKIANNWTDQKGFSAEIQEEIRKYKESINQKATAEFIDESSTIEDHVISVGVNAGTYNPKIKWGYYKINNTIFRIVDASFSDLYFQKHDVSVLSAEMALYAAKSNLIQKFTKPTVGLKSANNSAYSTLDDIGVSKLLDAADEGFVDNLLEHVAVYAG